MYACMDGCMHVSMYLCIYVSMYLCIYVSMYLCIYVPMYLCVYVSMYLCICVSMYLCSVVSIFLSIYLPVYSWLYLSVCLSACLSMYVCMYGMYRCVWNISTAVNLVPGEPSFLFLVFAFIVAGGQEPMTVCPGQRKPDSMGVKTHLQCAHHDGMWPNQEPPCRVYHLMMKCLHCCRNLGFNEDHIRILWS